MANALLLAGMYNSNDSISQW